MKLNKALICAGGFGTRMKELTKTKPKPMLQLQGLPILQYSIELCKKYGIRDIAISVHYLPEIIIDYFKDGSDFGVNIKYIHENTPMGTAGALRLYAEWFDQPFMMCNADELKDINLQEMHELHIANNALATVALTEVSDPEFYGVVDLSGHKIKRFVEKPKKEEAPSNFINAGLYIIDPKVLDYLPTGYSMIEKDVFPKLASQNLLFGYKIKGQWFDTGTLERYEKANRLWKGFTEKNYELVHERRKTTT